MNKLEMIAKLQERQKIIVELKDIRNQLNELKNDKKIKSYIEKNERETKLKEILHHLDTNIILKKEFQNLY